MKRYAKYKPSGVEWIGDIPEHWEVKKLKYLACLREENVDHSDFQIAVENIESETGKLVDMDETKSYQGKLSAFKHGDIIFNKLRPYLHKVYLAEKEGGLFGELLIIYSKGELTPEFLFYKLFSKSFIDVVDSSTQGAKMPRANWNDFISQLLICFPKDQTEQSAISHYLDKKKTEIDALIEKKTKLADRLKEERNALINEALSGKGRNWKKMRLKYLAKMQGGFAFSSDDFTSEGIQLIKIGNLYQNELSLDRQPTFLPETFLEEYKDWTVKDGDILISMTGTLGKRDYGYAVKIKDTGSKFLLNQRVSKILFDETILIKELGLHILRSKWFLDQLFLLPTGTKQGNFSNEQVLSILISYPTDIKEQESTISYIEKEFHKIESVISKIEKEVHLIQMYRTALINEVATGKINVI